MSRHVTAAARLLLVSLPFSIAYPQILTPLKLLNAAAPPTPLSTGAPGEMTIYNYNDSAPTNNYSDPLPIPIEPGVGDDSGSETFDPLPILPYPDEPRMTSPMDPIFVDLMYPPPPMEAPEPPSISISTLLSIVQPLLDIIATLLPPSDGGWFPTPATLPFQMGLLEKRSVATDQYVGAVTEEGKPFFRDLIRSFVESIQSLLESHSAGSAGNATGTVTPTFDPVTGILGGLTGNALRVRQVHTPRSIVGTTKPIPEMVEPVYGGVPTRNIDRAQQLLAVLNSLLVALVVSQSALPPTPSPNSVPHSLVTQRQSTHPSVSNSQSAKASAQVSLGISLKDSTTCIPSLKRPTQPCT
jgi:hypothetical protein